MGFLELEDERFWDRPLADEGAVVDRLFDQDVRGALLDAPARVPIAERDSLPVVGGQAATYAELRTRELRRDAVLVGVQRGTGQLLVQRFVSTDELPADLPPRPPADSPAHKADGVAVVLLVQDARARLNLPWSPGRWRLTLLLGEHASPPVEVELVGPARYQDPAVAEFVARHRRVGFPRHVAPAVRPGADLPRYRDVPGAPPPPSSGAGVTLASPPVAVAGEPCPLRGVVRRAPRPAEVVRPRPADPEPADLPPELRWQDVGDPEATCVLSVSLVLLVGGDLVAPLLVELQVPSYEPCDPAAPGEVTASFAVDLTAVASLGDPGEVIVRAFTGEVMSEAARVVLVSPDRLRGE